MSWRPKRPCPVPTLVTHITPSKASNMASTRRLQASSPVPKAPLTKPHTFTPRRRSTATQREPLTTWAKFVAAHRANQTMLSNYVAAGRKQSVRLARAVLDELDPRATNYLYANNTDARIRFARVAARQIGEMAEGSNQAFSWVTLAPKKFVVAEQAAASFDPKRIQAWTRQELHGLNFIGMVEPALYTNVGDIMAGIRRVVAWHVHVISWGVSEARLAAIMDGINRRYDALLPGVDPAFGVPLANEDVVGKALYMLKAPMSEYRVYAKRATRFDRETGEITTPTTGRFKQKKQALRPGDMVRMCNVLADKHLHRLLFAGGRGVRCLKRSEPRRWSRFAVRKHEKPRVGLDTLIGVIGSHGTRDDASNLDVVARSGRSSAPRRWASTSAATRARLAGIAEIDGFVAPERHPQDAAHEQAVVGGGAAGIARLAGQEIGHGLPMCVRQPAPLRIVGASNRTTRSARNKRPPAPRTRDGD